MKYEYSMQQEWDSFVRSSKNGVFFQERNYMEYHSDRFVDDSLMFYKEGKLIALLPANREGMWHWSHQGLTFGGFITDGKMRVPMMLEVFSAWFKHLSDTGIGYVYYRAAPWMYAKSPSEEDLYALHQHGAGISRRDVSSAIALASPLVTNAAERKARKARSTSEAMECRVSADIEEFMELVNANCMEKYGVPATHTPEEMVLLKSRFPDNIVFHAVRMNEELLAGGLIYESAKVAHAQYIAVKPAALKLGAHQLLVNYLLDYYKDKAYFDFGTSTPGGKLNEGVIHNKESYGARAVIYDTYWIDL